MATQTKVLRRYASDSPRIGRLGVGDCLGATFAVWAKNPLAFVLLTLVVEGPLILWQLLSPPEPVQGGFGFSILGTIQQAASFTAAEVTGGALAFAVVQQMRGSRASVASSILVGLRRFLPVLGVAVAFALFVTIGFVLMTIPGLILSCVYWVAVPAAVVERLGVRDALARSANLTRGSRWRVLWVTTLLGLLAIGALVLNWNVIFPGSLSQPTPGSIAVQTAVVIVAGSLSAVATAVGYFRLRVAKEGVSLDELATVFD
jgi:hypothetical protein